MDLETSMFLCYRILCLEKMVMTTFLGLYQRYSEIIATSLSSGIWYASVWPV